MSQQKSHRNPLNANLRNLTSSLCGADLAADCVLSSAFSAEQRDEREKLRVEDKHNLIIDGEGGSGSTHDNQTMSL